MKRFSLLFLILISVSGLFLAVKISAQELLIDENGKGYVQWQGKVLGETTMNRSSNTTKSTNSTAVEDDPEDETDEIENENTYMEEIRNMNNAFKNIDLDDDRLRVRLQSTEDDDEEATRPAQSVKTIRVRENKSLTDVVIKTSDDGVEITQGKVRTRTNFPITIGPANELIVTTPAGTKVVAILPDAALKNLLQKGFPMTPPTPTPGEGTDSGELEETIQIEEETEITLEEENGKLVYKAKSKKKAKLLGIIDVEGEVQAEVSAETGQIIKYSEPWYFSYFSFLFR